MTKPELSTSPEDVDDSFFVDCVVSQTGQRYIVRGAKPWAAAHYFLAAIRRDRVYTSCAIATARFRAKPSRA